MDQLKEHPQIVELLDTLDKNGLMKEKKRGAVAGKLYRRYGRNADRNARRASGYAP